jgi:hypothetical protein
MSNYTLNLYYSYDNEPMTILVDKKRYQPDENGILGLPYSGNGIKIIARKAVFVIPSSLLNPTGHPIINVFVSMGIADLKIPNDDVNFYFALNGGTYQYIFQDDFETGHIVGNDFSVLKDRYWNVIRQKYWEFINNLTHPLSYQPPTNDPTQIPTNPIDIPTDDSGNDPTTNPTNDPINTPIDIPTNTPTNVAIQTQSSSSISWLTLLLIIVLIVILVVVIIPSVKTQSSSS